MPLRGMSRPSIEKVVGDGIILNEHMNVVLLFWISSFKAFYALLYLRNEKFYYITQ